MKPCPKCKAEMEESVAEIIGINMLPSSYKFGVGADSKSRIDQAAQEIVSLYKTEMKQLQEKIKMLGESRDFWKNEYRRIKI